jgi:hypothetical protein
MYGRLGFLTCGVRADIYRMTTPDDECRPSRTGPPPGQCADPILRHHLRGHFGNKAVITPAHEEGLWCDTT